MANTTWWTVLFLVVVPLALVLEMLVVRTHTTTRMYHAVEKAALAAGMLVQGRGGNVTRYQTYLRPIRAKTMLLLRQRRLVYYDDVEWINEYIKSHL